MSDEPNQPTPPQPEEKPSEPAPVAPPVLPASTSAPPVIPPRKSPIPKKPTPSWVFPLLRCILAFGIVGLGCLALVIPGYILSDWDWPHVWAIILLVACGEMGRTPKINKRGGRDHWGRLAPLLLAGGGLPMGQVIGQSTPDAGAPASEPMSSLRVRMGTTLRTPPLRRISKIGVTTLRPLIAQALRSPRLVAGFVDRPIPTA